MLSNSGNGTRTAEGSRRLCRLACLAALTAWALAGLPGRALAGPGVPNDQGTFEISMAGKRIGTEKFQIDSAGDRVRARAEIELSVRRAGKTLTFHTFSRLVLDSQLLPLSYTWLQKGPASSEIHIDFTTSPAKARYRTVHGKDDLREFLLPQDLVVLDDNVFSQYEILVKRYDQTLRGQQAFRAFIPQEALPGQVKVQETAVEAVRIHGKTLSLRHLVATTDLARLDLWADAQGRLWRVSVPALQFNAVRQQ